MAIEMYHGREIKSATKVVFEAITVDNEHFGIRGGSKYTIVMIFGNSNQIEKPQIMSNWVDTWKYKDANFRILNNMRKLFQVNKEEKHLQRRRTFTDPRF